MPFFLSPPSGELGEYDLDGKFSGSIWRMRVARGEHLAGVALWGADPAMGFSVRSNNPTVIQNPLPVRQDGDLRILTMKGFNTGTTMIEVSKDGVVWASLQVQVVPALSEGHTGDRLIRLSENHMALNAPNAGTKLNMKITKSIPRTMPARDVIALVKAARTLKHLVFNAHGYFVAATKSFRIELGTGFTLENIELFGELKSTMAGGVIWLSNCAVGNDDSNKQRAALSGCHIVAPINYMQIKAGTSSSFPYGKVDMRERFQPIAFTPQGAKIDWATFMRMGKQFGMQAS